MFNSIRFYFVLCVSFFLASCATEQMPEGPDVAVSKTQMQQTAQQYPAYSGQPQRVMVFPWNISKVDLEKYPHFRDLQIGFGLSNRLLEELFNSGRFQLIEEKQAVLARMLQQMQKCTVGLCDQQYAPVERLPKAEYIVYPEVYHVGIEKQTRVQGLSAKANARTEIGVQINFVEVNTGITRSLASMIGSQPSVYSSSILSAPNIEFSQSALGKAANQAIRGALIKAMGQLPAPKAGSGYWVQQGTPMQTVPEPMQKQLLPRKSTSPAAVAKTVSSPPKSTTSASNRLRPALVAPVKKSAARAQMKGQYHALLIGNNNYRHVDKLETAINDAKQVSQTLKQFYGYQTKVLIDASREDIIAELDNLRGKLARDDKLLIYYAGHGYFDEDADRGYWLPVDASEKNTAKWISNTDITDKVKAIAANHVIVVADSCYSGTLTRGLAIDIKSHETLSDYHQRMLDKRSRTVMASGGLEPVADGGRDNHSVFAGAFLDALSENQNVMDGTDLFHKIRRQVVLEAHQTPEYSDIRFAGHRGGDFLFIRR